MYQEQPLDLSTGKNTVESEHENENDQCKDNDDQGLNDNSTNISPKSSNCSQEADIVDILLNDYYDDISNEFLEPGQELDKMVKMEKETNNENLSIHYESDFEETCKFVIDENSGMKSNVETDESSEPDMHSNSKKCKLKDDNNSNEIEKESLLISLLSKRSGQSFDPKIYQNKPLSVVSHAIKNEEWFISFTLNKNQCINSKNKTNLNEAESKRFQQIYFNLTKQYRYDNLLHVLYIYSQTDYDLLRKHLQYFQLRLYHIFFGLINDNSVVLTKQILRMLFKMLDKFSIDNTKFWTEVIKTINSQYGINYKPSQKLQFLFEQICQHLEERKILLNCLLFEFIFRVINPFRPINIIKPLTDPYFCSSS